MCSKQNKIIKYVFLGGLLLIRSVKERSQVTSLRRLDWPTVVLYGSIISKKKERKKERKIEKRKKERKKEKRKKEKKKEKKKK